MTSFCVYGLGVTGQAVINYFTKKIHITDYCAWDYDAVVRNLFGIQVNERKGRKNADL